MPETLLERLLRPLTLETASVKGIVPLSVACKSTASVRKDAIQEVKSNEGQNGVAWSGQRTRDVGGQNSEWKV